MPSTASEFKNRARKIITLPSGLEVEIRKFRLTSFATFGELPLPMNDKGKDKSSGADAIQTPTMQVGDLDKYSNRAIIASAISPRFTDNDEEAKSEEFVHVDDLSMEDWHSLVIACFNFSGITQEVAADAERFRNDEIGSSSKGSGGKVSQTANGDSSTKPG